MIPGANDILATVLVPVVVCAAVLLAVSAAVFVRAVIKRRYERAGTARLPVGADGIIVGAGPIDLPGPGDGRSPAALLLHGFGDTPQTLAYLAARLHERGWTVRVPLLPGHGRTLPAWHRTGYQDWLSASRDALTALRDTHATVALVGLSMGGALATILAAETAPAPAAAGSPARNGLAVPDRGAAMGDRPPIAALALIAPYLAMPGWMRRLAGLHNALSFVLPYVQGSGKPSILDAAERERTLAYGATTPRLVDELAQVVSAARAALPAIAVPTIVVQSHQDNRIAPAVAEWAFAQLTVPEKRLSWIDHGGHVITVDRGRDEVATAVGDWLDAHVPARAAWLSPIMRHA